MFNGMSLAGAAMVGAGPSSAPFLSDFLGYLLDATGITAKLGHVPQGTKDYPVVVLNQTGGSPSLGMATGVRLISANLQLDVYSPDYLDALATADRLRVTLQDFRGYMGATRVSDCTITNDRTGWASLREGDDVGLHSALLEVTIWYYSGESPP